MLPYEIMTPFEVISSTGASITPLFVFGDHTSKAIPKSLSNLGLSGDDVTRHIAWDIGTDALVRGLCVRFGCAGHLAGVSRLVIDCNRDPNALGLIPESSDGTLIPLNQNIMPSERAHRIASIHTPYHASLSASLDRVSAQDPLIVSVHSFTPKLRSGGASRPTDIGLLFKGDLETAIAAKQGLKRARPDFVIGMNKPYSAFKLNYTVDTHVMERGLRHITFEVRQDLVDTKQKQIEITDVLARAIKALI